ncbi:MAG: peptidase M14 [Planctomycetes bacterium]|nr:peptidase M14 [Planctomycetota bacterium]
MTRRIAVAIALVLLAATGCLRAQLPGELAVPIRFNRYHDQAEINALLDRYQKAFPELARVETIGRSHEGRPLRLITLMNPATGKERDKAAMYIDANVHGNEIQGAEVCLYTIAYLLENHGKQERLTRLLDERVFYILPSVNPDGRDYWISQANTPSSSRSGLRPIDNDRDGLADEDGPNDLDGDGSITMMRQHVGHGGTHKIDPADPRFLVRVGADEDGDWIILGSEGIDDDDDGQLNEDGPGGYDLNRNNPTDWQPEYVQFGAGAYPFSEPETRAVGDFLRAHPNIASLQSYHNAGGMILRGPGAANLPEYPRADVQVYDELGREGERILPFYRYMILHKDLYTVHGGFVNYAAEGLGIISFTNELWNDSQRFQTRETGPDDRKDFNDLVMMGSHYHDWKPFQHPRYGAIEIGGWTKDSGRVNPPFLLEETCHRNTAFTLNQAEHMPKLRFLEAGLEDLGEGLRRVTVAIRNDELIPTRTVQAAANLIGLPDFLELSSPEPFDCHAAAELLGREPELRRRPHLLDRKRLRLEDGLGSRQTRRFEWLVSGPGPFVVEFRSEKGGRQVIPLAP